LKRAWVLYAALGAVLLSGVYETPWDRIGGQDWNFFLSQSQAEVTSIRAWGQFPLWAPWRRGGQPSFGQAQSMLLSPVTPLALAFGVLAAFKLLLLPLFVAGCLGMHALAGQLGLRGLSRLVPGLVFFGSSLFPLHVRGGLPNYLFAFALLPWILYALRRARSDPRWLAGAALLIAGLFFCGAVYQFVFFPLLLGLDAAVECVRLRSVRPALLFAVAMLAAVALAAPRVLPVADVWAQYPRPVAADESWLSPALLLRAWADPVLPQITTPQSAFVVTPSGGVYWIYAGAFIGPLALLLALVALRAWRDSWGWLLAAACFCWLSLGAGTPASLWNALHRLPVFGSMRFPERQLALATFAVAVLAGHGFQQMESWWQARRSRAGAAGARATSGGGGGGGLVPVLALALLVVPIAVVNAPITRGSFDVAPRVAGQSMQPFRQQRTERRPEQWGGEVYETILANTGNTQGMSDIPTPDVVRAAGDPDYRGEVYLLGSHGSVESEVTPSAIDVSAQLTDDDVLVVNQNWFAGWRVESDLPADAAREPVNRGDLIALPLPAGDHRLRLVYAPPAVRRGFLLGGLAAAVIGAWLVARRTRRGSAAPAPAPAPAPDGPRAASFGRADAVALCAVAGLVAGVALSLPAPRRAPLAEELGWAQGAFVVDAAATDGDVAEHRAFRDVQSALDAAPPGSRVVLHAGDYEGFVLRKALRLAALSGGPVRVRGAVEVTGLAAGERACLLSLGADPVELAGPLSVHDGAGLLQLQSVNLPLGALTVQRWGRLELFGCRVRGALSVDRAALFALKCAFEAAPTDEDGAERAASAAGSASAGGAGAPGPRPALDAVDGVLLLNECIVRGGTPAVRLVRSRLVGASAKGQTWGGAAGAHALTLASDSHARLSGITLEGEGAQSDGSSDLERLELPRIALHTRHFFGGTELQCDVVAAPGAQGHIVVASATVLEPQPGPLGFLQCDILQRHSFEAVTIPASGRLQHQMHLAGGESVPARGTFAQFVVSQPPGGGPPLYSLLDGSLDNVRLPLP